MLNKKIELDNSFINKHTKGLIILLRNFSFLIVIASASFLIGQYYQQGIKNKNIASHIKNIIIENNITEIEAKKLSWFIFKKVCFERSNKINLYFFIDEKYELYQLEYKDFYVHENYIEKSIDGKCFKAKCHQ